MTDIDNARIPIPLFVGFTFTIYKKTLFVILFFQIYLRDHLNKFHL